jgi:hypothetical protein
MTAGPLVGTWQLVSFAVQDADGRITYPFGEDVEGFITYTADDRMAVHLGAAHRTHLAAPDWFASADAEIAAAARDYFAYCGTYEIHDDIVIHRVESSLIPNWIGKEQRRHMVLDGNTVTLSTSPTSVGGREQVATLVWQRVGGQALSANR